MMRSILFVGALATSIACATGGTTASGVHRDPNLITEQEVMSSNGANAFEVISRERPAFLKQRGHTSVNLGGMTPTASPVNGSSTMNDYASVYINSQQYGDVTSLRGIAGQQIKEIRYYSATDAVTKFGSQNGTGVIQIITK